MAGWRDLNPELRAIAEEVLTPEQLLVMKLKAGGLGYKLIGRHLGVTPEAVRGRHERAKLNIARAINERRHGTADQARA